MRDGAKSICQKCLNHFWEKMGFSGWGKDDDKRWIDGQILCPYRELGQIGRVEVSDVPLKRCPFILEHMLTQELEEDRGQDDEVCDLQEGK